MTEGASLFAALIRALGAILRGHEMGLWPKREPEADFEAFEPAADDPYAQEHGAILAWVDEEFDARGDRYYYEPELKSAPAGQAILDADAAASRRLVIASVRQTRHWDGQFERIRRRAQQSKDTQTFHRGQGWQEVSRRHRLTVAVTKSLMRRNLPFDEADLLELLNWALGREYFSTSDCPVGAIARALERFANTNELSAALLDAMRRFADALSEQADKDARRYGTMVAELCAGSHSSDGRSTEFRLNPGEVWSDTVNNELSSELGEARKAWFTFLRNASSATSAKPSAKWLKTTLAHADAVGQEALRRRLLGWLSHVPAGRSAPGRPAYDGDVRAEVDLMDDQNADCLRGILWTLGAMKPDAATARAIGIVTTSAYRKVPGVGPRAVKVGNAGVYALSAMGSQDAVAQLAILKARVKFGTAQKMIDKAFSAAAERLGLPRDEIEEMAVPTYGLEEVGLRREAFGDYTAELVVTGVDGVDIRWHKADGKPLKSVPAAVRKEHGDDLKELTQARKDIQGMLPAQRQRVDALFQSQRSWSLAAWRERYLDHPLVGVLARPLIWRFSKGKKTADGIFLNGAIVDVEDQPIDWLDDETRVELWHPIGRTTDEIVAWRQWLQRHEVRQPFKQAHREVYLLTDAELNTRTYSNRFAAHVLRQHQFNALCAARSWKNKLRLMVDDEYPPATRLLPEWNLRAEYWIEGIGEEYGADTNESGVYLRIATDQVRFYPLDAAQVTAHAGGGRYGTGFYQPNAAEPIPLEDVPPLVFSEIMRDVDLFVGVASIGNDPTWQDGGPEGRYRDYWTEYAWGDLAEAAKTRKAVLEALIPRLAIADRCSFTDKFLVVRGDLRTYKIHLGSANILMEPNDQYLCIVPARGAATAALAGGAGRGAKAGRIYLPFEGDERLAVILSKALMLAEDTRIKDPTITRQIGGN